MEQDLSDVLDNELIIQDRKDQFKSKKASTMKGQNKKRKREVRVADKTLLITQKVDLKKQKHKCVANLNTSSQRNMQEKSCKKSVKLTKNVMSERFLPRCLRKHCNAVCDRKQHARNWIQRKRSNRRRYECKKSITRARNKKKSNTTKYDYNVQKRSKYVIEEHSLSPISISSLSSDPPPHQVSYDDVSLGSFSCCSESELDTLIKRTKEREKHMAVSSNFLSDSPLYASTPHGEIAYVSSDDNSVGGSKHDMLSLHSQATLVLDHPAVCSDIPDNESNKCCIHMKLDENHKSKVFLEKCLKSNDNTEYDIKPNLPGYTTNCSNETNNNNYNNVNTNNNIIYSKNISKIKSEPIYLD